ncbi:MAG TPA: hypothetical protein VM163_00335 [bacterium]|nr:hypothetical protein [bacterium]
MVVRKRASWFVVAILLVSVAELALAEARFEAPKFKVGQWISYSMTNVTSGGKTQTLEVKYSVVGSEKYEGQECFWHELAFIRKEQTTIYRMLLPPSSAVSEETMLCFLSVLPNVGDAKRYILWTPGTQPTEANMGVINSVSDDLAKEGKRKGFAQDEPIRSIDEMKLVQAGVSVKAVGKDYKCDRFTATLKSKLSNYREWKYEVWRSRKIPVFGLAKLVYEKVLFGKSERMELLIKGFGFSGAKTAVPGETIKADMRFGKGSSAPRAK